MTAERDAPKLTEAPSPKSRWLQIGDHSGQVATVMTVSDNWVMARFKGCIPFTEHVNQWHKGFVPAPPLEKKQRRAALAQEPA